MSVRARRRQARLARARRSARVSMGDEDVRVLVQRPTVVKKLVAKKAAKQAK